MQFNTVPVFQWNGWWEGMSYCVQGTMGFLNLSSDWKPVPTEQSNIYYFVYNSTIISWTFTEFCIKGPFSETDFGLWSICPHNPVVRGRHHLDHESGSVLCPDRSPTPWFPQCPEPSPSTAASAVLSFPLYI